MTQIALFTLTACISASIFALSKAFKKPKKVQIIQMRPLVLIGDTIDITEPKRLTAY